MDRWIVVAAKGFFLAANMWIDHKHGYPIAYVATTVLVAVLFGMSLIAAVRR